MQTALSETAERDDAAAMARLLLTCVREPLIPRASPLEAVRAGQLERAWQLADLADEGRRYLWHLLLAWELRELGRPAEALTTLERLRGQEPPEFEDGDGACAAFLVMNLSDLDRELAGALYRTLTEESDCFPTPQALAALSRWPITLEAARGLPNEDRRDEALQAIAAAQARAGAFIAAADTAQGISSRWKRAEALTSIAAILALAGERESARDLLAAALAVAQSMKRRRDETLKRIALAAAQTGDLRMVGELAPRIRHPGWRGEVEAALAGAQACQGDLEAALEIAGRIRSPEARTQALIAIARAQAHAGDRLAGCLTLGTALQAAADITSRTSRARVLQEIGVLQAKWGEREAARRTVGALIDMAQSLGSRESQVWMLGVAGLAQVRAGETAPGQQTLEAAREATGRIEDTHLRSKAQRSLATDLGQGGEFGIALATAAGIEDPHQRSRALAAIAAAQSQAGQLEAARETARRIDEVKPRVQALQELAAAERSAGDIESARVTLALARDVATQCEEAWNRFPLLNEIALYHLEMQDAGAARDTFALLLIAAQATVDRDRRDSALVALATAQASAGAVTEAMESARAIGGRGYRQMAFGEVARGHAAAGEIEAAWEIVEQHLDPYPDDRVMAAVVTAQVQAEGREQAPLGTILVAVRQRARVLEDGGDRQCMLGEIALALARVQAFLPALEVAQEIEWDDRRGRAGRDRGAPGAKRGSGGGAPHAGGRAGERAASVQSMVASGSAAGYGQATDRSRGMGDGPVGTGTRISSGSSHRRC